MSKNLYFRPNREGLLLFRSQLGGHVPGDGIINSFNSFYEQESYKDYSQNVVLSTDFMSEDDINKLSGKVITRHISEIERR